MKVMHVIPVPRHMSVDEAWEEIRLMGCLLTENVDPQCRWAVIEDEEDDDG